MYTAPDNLEVQSPGIMSALTYLAVFLILVVSVLSGLYLGKTGRRIVAAQAQTSQVAGAYIDVQPEEMVPPATVKADLEEQKAIVWENTKKPEPKPVVVPKYPFATPTTGTLGHSAGSFGGKLYDMIHRGVDIWTTTSNHGAIPSHKGNPVHAACSGKVTNIFAPNGAIVILCDPISDNFDVPKKQGVYTYYGHMGHAETKQLYIEVKRNQRVEKGQLLGYQGDLSSYFPQMRNVHLHFSVFTGISEIDKNGGALNPCLYIGGNCNVAGSKFSLDRSVVLQ